RRYFRPRALRAVPAILAPDRLLRFVRANRAGRSRRRANATLRATYSLSFSQTVSYAGLRPLQPALRSHQLDRYSGAAVALREYRWRYAQDRRANRAIPALQELDKRPFLRRFARESFASMTQFPITLNLCSCI